MEAQRGRTQVDGCGRSNSRGKLGSIRERLLYMRSVAEC
jgi:hypothetical protein